MSCDVMCGLARSVLLQEEVVVVVCPAMCGLARSVLLAMERRGKSAREQAFYLRVSRVGVPELLACGRLTGTTGQVCRAVGACESVTVPPPAQTRTFVPYAEP